MSDLHKLPLVGHDLPEYLPAKRPVRVFREGLRWTWEHHCRCRRHPVNGYPHASQEEAMDHALKHWRNCW